MTDLNFTDCMHDAPPIDYRSGLIDRMLVWLTAAEFASAQSDAYANPDTVGNPEGGWEDEEYTFDAPWEEEAWDYSGAY